MAIDTTGLSGYALQWANAFNNNGGNYAAADAAANAWQSGQSSSNASSSSSYTPPSTVSNNNNSYSSNSGTVATTNQYTPYYGSYNGLQSLASWAKDTGNDLVYSTGSNKVYINGVAYDPNNIPGTTFVGDHNYVSNSGTLLSDLQSKLNGTATTVQGNSLSNTIMQALAALGQGPKQPDYVKLPKMGSTADYLEQATDLTKEQVKATNLEILAKYKQDQDLLPYKLNARQLNQGGTKYTGGAKINQDRALALDLANAKALAVNSELATQLRNQDYQAQLAQAQAMNNQALAQYNADVSRYTTMIQGLLSLYTTNAGITQNAMGLYGSGQWGTYSPMDVLNQYVNGLNY